MHVGECEASLAPTLLPSPPLHPSPSSPPHLASPPQAEGGPWISDVAWCGPTSPFLVAATSHDAKLRLWDLRGNKPLYTLRAGYLPKKSKANANAEAIKALAAAWSGSKVGAGGSDSTVHMYELSDLS